MTATTQQTLRDAVAADIAEWQSGAAKSYGLSLAEHLSRFAGPIAAHIASVEAERDAARAELAKVATVVRAAAIGEWTDSFEAMVEESCAWEVRALAAEVERDAWMARCQERNAEVGKEFVRTVAAEAEVARLTARVTEMEGALANLIDVFNVSGATVSVKAERVLQVALVHARSALLQKDADHGQN